MYRLSQLVNASVQVAGDTLFGDPGARVCVLLGVEEFGVWLKSDELTSKIYSEYDETHVPSAGVAVFIPFTQIQYIAPAQLPVSASQATLARASVGGKLANHNKTKPKHGKK